jgi:hypothetical protein
VAISVVLICIAGLALAFGYFIHLAPPSTITITAGPEGSSSQRQAAKYAKILERDGVKLKILTSNGSFENLKRLMDPKSKVDVGFVQGGVTKEGADQLVSLGNISYQPLMIFHRGKPMKLLSDLSGKRIAIGEEGSGAHVVALALLDKNGIKEGGKTTFVPIDGETAAKALLDGQVDAAFIMGESTPTPVLKQLLLDKGLQLYSFQQGPAYARKIDFLNVLELPEGAIDLGLNIPAQNTTLVGPMVELIATKKLHPALAELLFGAMVETHSRPGMYQKRGEFPNAQEHLIPMSENAARFFQSGRSFLYRYLPFWFASFVSRFMIAFLPTLILLVPFIKGFLALLKWRVSMRIRRHYKELLELEKRFQREHDPARRALIRREFDRIEGAIGDAKIRPAFADQFYGLRGHINYVRDAVGRGGNA